MNTIGGIVSRIRGTIKETTDDSVYSNRTLWYTFFTYAKQLIKESADKGQIYDMSNIWETICIEMEPVSSLYCNCQFLPYDCIVYRSKLKLPVFMESGDGFIYRWIATPDLSQDFVLVTPYQYHNKSRIKYNREKYAFIHDGYLYTPKHTFPIISMSALFPESINDFLCGKSKDELDKSSNTTCNSRLDKKIQLPDHLEYAAIKMTLSELIPSIQIPFDENPNSNTNQKEVSP